MEQVEVTLLRALKIWWSWAWRAWVLSMLVVVPIDIVFAAFVMGHPFKPGADPAEAVRALAPMMILWPLVLVAVVALQAQAMRWMLGRARWSDFRLAVLQRDV